MEIKDPCKAGKCISYPVCINKQEPTTCDILRKYLRHRIVGCLLINLEKNNYQIIKAVTDTQMADIRYDLIYIFRNLQLSHKVDPHKEYDGETFITFSYSYQLFALRDYARKHKLMKDEPVYSSGLLAHLKSKNKQSPLLNHYYNLTDKDIYKEYI